MPPIQLPRRKILRFKTDEEALQALEHMPAGHAFRNGNEVHLLRPVNMTFSPVDLPVSFRR